MQKLHAATPADPRLETYGQLFYDQAPLNTDQAKAENRATRTKRFNEALDAMKQMAESP